MNEDVIIHIYCVIDDFCKAYSKTSPSPDNNASSTHWWTTRESKLSLSEKLTISCPFDFYRCFQICSKKVFVANIFKYLQKEF